MCADRRVAAQSSEPGSRNGDMGETIGYIWQEDRSFWHDAGRVESPAADTTLCMDIVKPVECYPGY